ncbi:hypothetical protein BT93_B1552 [Corymbia citriodora subsp. variegata]|nr:hypothetical protein BT93_B1552 [Corymbia citriodora subsp. variegata]
MAEACATSIASNLVSKLGEYLIAPIGRQFAYVLCYKRYVEDLKKGVKELETAKERVQHSVEEAVNDGKLIQSDVKNWLESVENKSKEAENLLKHGESAKTTCFRGWLPNPVVSHPIGRKVKKMTQVIQGLSEKSANINFQKVYYEKNPTGIVSATTSVATSIDNIEDVLESRAKITEDVIRAIIDDNVYVIGVCGPGGVGKSKLLEDIKRRVKEKQLFDVVVMADVSRNPDLRRIQGEIADSLGLKLMNVETNRGRADRLRERLEDDPMKNVLIILDNLWQKLDLKEVGIPCRDDNKVKGCKLLLSSRYRDVLRIDMGSNQEFRVEELKYGEARRLFERTVGERVNDLEFQGLVDRVVKNCGGLPLLILSVAKRLKHGDLAEWRNALTNMDLSDAKSIVELNYNDLKVGRIKSLFLVCALDSGRTSMRDFLVYCMGLGLYKEFSKTIENARDRLIMDLHRLQDSSLLDSDDMESFKMHDIFIDMAISIAFVEWHALAGKKDYGFKEWSKDELEKCTVISFPRVGIDELPEKLDCPNLRMLLLNEYNPSLKIPESFFESMGKLHVLDFTGIYFTSLPSSIEFLVNLKSLCLDLCHLEDVTILGKLKGLQFLSFFRSCITRLPKQIGELTDLRFLDLRGCTKLTVIEPNVLGSLVNLEELYMEDSFDQWEAENEALQSNASVAELKNMKKLSTLYIAIPHSTNLSRDLPFGKLNNYKIQIGDIWDWSDEYKESRTLKLKLDSHNFLLEEWVQRSLQLTQDLHVDGLQDGYDSIHDLCMEGFEELKHLHVQNSPSFHYIVHSMDDVHCTAFMRLESLILENLNNLEKICHGCLTPKSFSKLKIVKMDKCGEIKHLFPLSMMRIFLQLEEIEISNCHLMQQIVADAKVEEDRDEIENDPKVQSYNLRRLTLRNLPETMSFYKIVDHAVIFFNEQQVSLPLLESLTLSELPKLKEIWNSQFPSNVSNLKFLTIEDCMSLSSIIPPNLLTKLQILDAITIKRCQSIQELFNLEGLIASGNDEIMSRLTQLTLSQLPSLGHIWNKNPKREFCFQNLRALKVQNCENLRFVFSSSMGEALRQLKEIEITSCKMMEKIMDVEEEESEEEAVTTNTLQFPMLASLSLEELPNLKTFCYGKYFIHYPSLTKLRISGCPKMMTFFSLEGKRQSMTTDTGLQQECGLINSGLSWPVFNQNVLFPSLEELTLLSLCGLRRIWHNELPEESFGRLASITVGGCENLSHIFPSTLIERFQGLKKIEVAKCSSLEALMEHVAINSKKRQKLLVLRDLKEVKLWHLPRLNVLVTSSNKATLGLPSLTKVSLRCCHSLRYLFTNDTARTLDKLEVLDVSSCDNMREVVAIEEGEEQTLKAVKYSHLSTLNLCSLKSLISFSSGSCAFRFPSLRNLSILECTKLKAFILRAQAPSVEMMNEEAAGFDESPCSLFDTKVIFSKLEELRLTGIQSREFWENEMPEESICHLKVLEVKQCHNLLYVIPSFTWKSLLHYIESLTVESCNSIEGIYTLEGLGVMEREAVRSSPLRKLSLCDLPNLIDIWKNEDLLNLCFHNLTSIRVDNCPRLTNLFTMFMAKSLGQLQHLHLAGCEEMEYIVAREKGQPEEVADRIIIPQLITLCLHNMPKLRSFCHGKHILEWPSLKGFTIEDCKAVEVILGHANCRKLEGNVPTQQPLLLVEKVCTRSSLTAYLVSCP